MALRRPVEQHVRRKPRRRLTLGVGLKYQKYSVSVARAVQTQELDTAPFQVTFGMSF